MIEQCLHALDFRFSDDRAHVDLKVFNAARIWKLYGTAACKGDNTPDRPHRVARLLRVPESIEVVPVEKLRAIAAMAPQAETPPERNGYVATFDLDQWISEHGLDVGDPQPWRDGRKWVFRVCPWNSAHTNGSAFIVQYKDGKIGAGSRWFGEEASRVYALIGGDAESPKAREQRQLLRVIRDHDGRITVRELMRATRRYRDAAADAEAALDGLVKAGLGRWQQEDHAGGRGRPVAVFQLSDAGDGDTNSEIPDENRNVSLSPLDDDAKTQSENTSNGEQE